MRGCPLYLCNSFHVNIVEAFLNFRSFLSAAVSCHLKHSCFYYYKGISSSAFTRPRCTFSEFTTGSNFFTLFGYRPQALLRQWSLRVTYEGSGVHRGTYWSLKPSGHSPEVTHDDSIGA